MKYMTLKGTDKATGQPREFTFPVVLVFATVTSAAWGLRRGQSYWAVEVGEHEGHKVAGLIPDVPGRLQKSQILNTLVVPLYLLDVPNRADLARLEAYYE
jgi:hypothetical protein